MANIVLALQGGVASGAEETFDGQPMQKGVHLRWSFLAALGFPPGGFWLCRRAMKKGEKQTPLPPSAATVAAATPQQAESVAATNNPAVGPTGGNPWEASMRQPCQSVTIAGCAAPGCEEVVIETFTKDDKGELRVSSRRVVPVEAGAFRVRVQAASISGVRVVGAGSVDECGCGSVEPPKDCGCGSGGGGRGGAGGNPPPPGKGGWGPTNGDGWQCWDVPFTLPVTVTNWPARYLGAPDPATTPFAGLVEADVKECLRRLGTLKLAAGLTTAQQFFQLVKLREELVRLVQGFPGTLLGTVPIPKSSAGANAPDIGITLMEELLLLALDPYFARVLGLYFVDVDATPGVQYVYSITGFWGSTPCQSTVVYPGLTPGAPLARGTATFDGLTITALGSATSLWRWTKLDAAGNYQPRTDPSAPPAAADGAVQALLGLGEPQLPEALLLAVGQGQVFPFDSPGAQFAVALTQPVPRVDVQVGGTGTVQAYSAGTVVASAPFGSIQLATVTLDAPGPDQLIDQLRVTGATMVAPLGTVVALGALTLHPLSPDAIGTRYAITAPPVAIQPVSAPGKPYTTFRHRQADIDTTALTLVPHSLFDVEWPAPPAAAADQTGNPLTDPLQLPPPTLPIGFVTERRDTGAAGTPTLLPGWITTRSAKKTAGSPIPTAQLFRRVDSQLPDPVTAYSHRCAGFDLFGALGKWSAWSAPRRIEKIAAAPTAMRIRQFDNNVAAGGGPTAAGDAWTGGTLDLSVSWSGAAYMMYPDVATARVTVAASAAPATPLATADFPVSPATIQALTISAVAAHPQSDGTYLVDVRTTPPLQALGPFDPGQVLQLTLPDGTTERFAVRPAKLNPALPGPAVARISAGPASRLVASTSEYAGQPAYLVSGFAKLLLLPVPLEVPIAQNTVRAQVAVTGSTQDPFDPAEEIIDPNGVNPPRPEPASTPLYFTAPQRLVPPAPPTPVHIVDHLYYEPADATGRASRRLPFATPGGAGISGYVLQRAPVRSIGLSDLQRRIKLGSLADNQPVVLDGGVPRPDLAAWIAALPKWLACYNAVAAAQGQPTVALADALTNTASQRAFIEHFYGGLLDDELRALGDLADNAPGFARVNPTPVAPASPLSDSVDGTGFGRTLYRLAAVNSAGSTSSTTGSIGPYYTRIVTAPRAPVLYKLQPTPTALIVLWSLDTNPDVAGYLVYRAASVDLLADLRYFGADWTHPSPPAGLPTVKYHEQTFPPLTFQQGTAPDIDARIVGFVPDPRLCARDYEGSDLAEVILPPGPPPDSVTGVYRLSDYVAASGPLSQPGFNYWTVPASGGVAQLKTDSPTQSRLAGLRVGLGRGVPVVVVATWGGVVKAVGLVPTRRAGFVDGVTTGGQPLDANAVPQATAPDEAAANAYVVVAVDIFGNRSLPSKAFASQMLAPVTA